MRSTETLFRTDGRVPVRRRRGRGAVVCGAARPSDVSTRKHLGFGVLCLLTASGMGPRLEAPRAEPPSAGGGSLPLDHPPRNKEGRPPCFPDPVFGRRDQDSRRESHGGPEAISRKNGGLLQAAEGEGGKAVRRPNHGECGPSWGRGLCGTCPTGTCVPTPARQVGV